LKLGSIGAQLGETINEFSSDPTLSGNSNLAIPTEAAVKGYVDNSILASRTSEVMFDAVISVGQIKTLQSELLVSSYEILTIPDTAEYTISQGAVHQVL
jgi:hypothetical protein